MPEAISVNDFPFIFNIHQHGLATLRDGIIDGLTAQPKHLSQLLLWNSKGLSLFNQFAQRDEYHPRWKEIELIRSHADMIAATIKPESIIVELGSGDHSKTAMILLQLQLKGIPFTYYALDVNRRELQRNISQLRKLLAAPTSKVYGLQGIYDDFAPWVSSLDPSEIRKMTLLWFGNSVANGKPADAVSTLKSLRRNLSPDLCRQTQIFIGADNCQDESQLMKAYDPNSPELKSFIFNGMHHANELLGLSAFDLEDWKLDVGFDRCTRTLEVFGKARHNLVIDLGEEKIFVNKNERVEMISSGKWSTSFLDELCCLAGYEPVNKLQHQDGDYTISLFKPGTSF